MIHTVKMPEQDAVWLNEILDLQLTILKVTAAMQGAIAADGSQLRDGLSEKPIYCNNAAAIAEWIIRKTELLKHLNAFAGFDDISAKDELVRKIEWDMALLRELGQTGTLHVRLAGQVKESWQVAIGRFLYQWYDLWSSQGLDSFLFVSRDQQQGKYTRQDFVRSYLDSNRHLLSCPICDAGAYRNETTKGVYTSIDHFFPRSLYPHLALHPYNLLPMCPACNSGQAGQRDPLDGCKSIAEINLPYRGKGLGERIYVKIDFRPYSDNDSALDTHALWLSFAVAAGEDGSLSTTIDRFNAIYGVADRWNTARNLTLIDEHVFRRIRQFLLSDVQRGETIHDPRFLQERLELLMALVQMEGLGRDPFAFVTVWWLMWQIQRLEKQVSNRLGLATLDTANCQELFRKMAAGAVEPLLVELAYWACEQQKGFALLKEEVQGLRRRIPAAGIESGD